MKTIVEREYRYSVYSSDGEFLAVWPDVISDFRLTDEMNTLGGALQVSLGRSINDKKVTLTQLLDETDQPVLDHNGFGISTPISGSVVVGEGTDVDVNNYLYVDEFYGSIQQILDEQGQPVLDQLGREILAGQGPVNGRRVFSGFISAYDSGEAADRETVEVDALPFSVDLEEYMAETPLGFNSNNSGDPNLAIGIGRQALGFRDTIVQSITATATGRLRFRVNLYSTDVVTYPTITLVTRLYSGNDPEAPGRALLQTSKLVIQVSELGNSISTDVGALPPETTVTIGAAYHLEITCENKRKADGTAPVFLYATPDVYATGTLWERVNGGAVVSVPGHDLFFRAFVETQRKTRWSFTNVDPSFFFSFRVLGEMNLDNTRLQTGAYGLPSYSIVPTNLTAPELAFNLNTGKESLDLALRAAPIGWFYRYDNSTRQIRFRPPSAVPDHVFTRGIELQELKVRTHIEDLTNSIYFVGGKPDGVEEPLFSRYEDAVSIKKYGRKSKRITDFRYKNQASMDIVGGYELTVSTQPFKEATITVLDSVYDSGTISVGQLIGFRAFDSFIDTLQMVVIRRDRQKGKAVLKLGTIPMTERRRLDEMRRAIAQLDAQDLPDEPS